jgi:Ca2+-binding RTX toxin-like protein
MSTPKVAFFNWDLTNPGTPSLTKVKGKKPKQNDVTLNINLNQSLVAANSAIISNAFIQFATFSTSATGNTSPYTITSGGKSLTLEKNFERLTVTVDGQIFTSYAQWQQFITPVTFATSVAPSSNVEGSFFTVTVTTTNVADGTVIPFVITGSDAVVTTSGNITINGGSGVATIATTSDADSTNDTATLTLQGIANGKPGSTATFTITEPAPAPDSVLTTAQDLVTATSASVFTIYGNETTLGQNDQLNGAPAGAAVLNIGTQGDFAIANFTSTDVETIEFRPADDLGAFGYFDMQSAFGVTDIVVEQSSLAEFYFDDIQSVSGLSATLTDSFSDFTFNFDASALLGSNDSLLVSFAEAPIDATTGEALGIVVTEGPFDAQADLEVLNLESSGPITNILDRLAVGEALATLNIFGSADLEVLPDIGFLGEGNSQISLIDASSLNADLNNGPSDAFFTYTSALSGAAAGFEVSVLGATGVNRLALGTAPLDQPATDFRVITQDSADQIFTVGGNDSILSAGGSDTVNAGDGNNTVRSGLGSDSVVAFGGNDVVEAGAGNNTVDAGDGNNSVTALDGNDSIRTGAGTDSINAGDGTNTVSAGGGNDSVITGIGNDLVFADDESGINDGNDTVRTGAGADTVYAGSGSNIIDAGTEADFVALGPYSFGPFGPTGSLKLGDDTFANTVSLGDGDDILAIDTDSLTIADSINGGAGLDTIQLFNGGVLSQSETLRVSRIETLQLVGQGNYEITLSDELVRTSDEVGSRVFNVAATNSAGNVTLDLSFLTPVDSVGELLSIRFTGQADTDTETVIIRDGLISDETVLAFGEAPADAVETFADIMQILDSVDITKDDLDNVSGLEVIELASSVNGPQTFTLDWRNMSEAEFDALVGDSTDVLIIRATPLLGNSSASTLNLDLTGATFDTSRIIIEQSAMLNVNVIGGAPQIQTALFFTPNADRIPEDAMILGNPPFIPDGATVIAYALTDLQDADKVNANGFEFLPETIEFRFAPSTLDTLFDQLNNIDVFGIDIFRFVPAAVNQAVSFNGIGTAGAFEGLNSIVTSGGTDLLVGIERSLYVETRGGDDTVAFQFNAGPATVVSGLGNDQVFTTDFNDVVDLGSGNNTAFTYFGNDSIVALDGDDFIFSGEDNDTVFAGSGDNVIFGDYGNDLLIALGGADSINGFDGNDSIDAGDGLNTVYGGFGADSVITGVDADFIITSVGTEVENDTVRSSSANDTVAVGLGDDFVDAGADNDLIVLGTQFNVDTDDDLDPVLTNDVGGYSAGDSINGGLGDDTVSLALAGASTTTLTNNIVNVESFNVNVQGDNASLIVGSNLVPLGSTYEFTISDNDIGDRSGFLFDATALVQTQQLIVNDADLLSADYRLGAGNDVYNGDSNDPTAFVTVAGNGGSDTINLTDAGLFVDAVNTIVYNTGNDGGQGGTGTGGDLITGYNIADDRILIQNGLLTDLGGIINAASKVTDAQLVLGGLTADDGSNLSGDNVLSLTGPSRSVLDSELTNAARIASNINGVGVIGNGLAIGDNIGGGVLVNRQTNQALIVQQGQTQTALYLYTESSFNFDVAQAYTVEAGELRQLGIFDNVLFTGTTEIV